MKRARSGSNPATLLSDPDDSVDAENGSLPADDGDQINAPLSDSSSASSSDADGEVDFGADAARDPILPMLTEVLSLMRPAESFGDTLKRLAKEKPAAVPRLTELHSDLLRQHDTLLTGTSRENLLLRAVSHAMRDGIELAPAWLLRWRATPAAVHGPFSAEEMETWAAGGFFLKKPGEVRNGNSLTSAWTSAQSQFPNKSS